MADWKSTTGFSLHLKWITLLFIHDRIDRCHPAETLDALKQLRQIREHAAMHTRQAHQLSSLTQAGFQGTLHLVL